MALKRLLRPLALTLAIAAVPLLLVEGAVRWWFPRRPAGGSPPGLHHRTETGDYSPKPHFAGTEMRADGSQITYRTDAWGRRSVPNLSIDSPLRLEHLLLFGCSYTFGHGLDERETLSYFLAKENERYEPYPYAANGWGLQQLLKVAERPLRLELKQSRGRGVYVFMDHHIQRAIGSFRYFTGWGSQSDAYTLDKNGRLVALGSFSASRPFLTEWYWFLNRWRILDHVPIDFPPWPRRAHFDLVAALIDELRTRYLKQFPANRFAVLIYPGSVYGGSLRAGLAQRQIEILDGTTWFSRDDGQYWIANDGHPSARANELIAGRMKEWLGKE